MEEGDVQAANDEDEDIYKDIGDFRYDRELTKLEESNKAYTEDIARLSKRINELTERNETLQSVNEILATNISILLKTAKAEIDRKQLVIDEFRRKLDVLHIRHERNERISSVKTESFKKSVDEMVESHCKLSDIEDGEIVGDDCAGKKFNSDGGNRDCSNSRDRGYHSGNHRKRPDGHEKLKGRSNDSCSGRRKSRYPDDNYTRLSCSSRNHRRSISPDTRGRSDSRGRSRDKIRHSSRSAHSHGSRSRKTETSPHRKEQSSRKGGESRLSVTKNNSGRLGKDGSTIHSREEKSNKSDCINDNKNRLGKPCGTKKEGKEMENEENRNVVKTLSVAEYRRRKSADGSIQKKSECDVLARQSVLADLYDEPADSKTFTEIPKDIGEEKDSVVPQSASEEGGQCDWPSGNGLSQWKNKESQAVKGPRTLYSRRMEAKYHQQQLMENGLSQKLESSCDKQLDRGIYTKVEGKADKTDEIDIRSEKITAVVEVAEKNGKTENNGERLQTGKEKVTNVDRTIEAATETVSESIQKSTEVNPDQAFGESLVKKLLQLQATEENVGINEFSPLKNNYKLSRISPLKPVSKQHILEYYNLKPSPQQLTNIEPEVLDFSFSLPETPGKNFFNSFLPLNDTKECARQEENLNNDKCTEHSPVEDKKTVADAKSGGESSIDDLITIMKPNRTKKGNCKTGKVNTLVDEASSESKKSVQTSDEEGGQGKSYNTRYHIRTRSKAENDKIITNETEDYDEKRGGRSRNGSEEAGGIKRERRLTLSDEVELAVTPKRMKCDMPKTENDTSIEVTAEGTVPDDITSFEVFRSVSDENIGNMSILEQQVTRLEEKSAVDDLPSWNGGDSSANKTLSNEDETGELAADKRKPSPSSTNNSGDSSNFKVLRSYPLLSANDDTDDEAFGSDNTSTGSGEYSDSGASALVDLL